MVVVGTKPCIVVSTVSVAEELFQANDANFLSRPTRLYWNLRSGSTEYKDFGAPYGKYWRQLRKLCNNELFSPKRQASYEKVRAEEVHDMLHSLLEESRIGNAVNLKLKLYGVAANTMTRMLTNKRFVTTLGRIILYFNGTFRGGVYPYSTFFFFWFFLQYYRMQ